MKVKQFSQMVRSGPGPAQRINFSQNKHGGVAQKCTNCSTTVVRLIHVTQPTTQSVGSLSCSRQHLWSILSEVSILQ